MPTLTSEDLAQVIRIVREIVNQEFEAKLPIYGEIVDLKSAVKELIEAQRRTEESLRELTLVVRDLQRQVGGIAHAVGFQLEDRVYISLPRLLKRDFGIEVKERLIRRYIKNKKGERLEINILGKGEREGKEIWIIGEAKANLSARHIEDFIDRLKDIKKVVELEIFPIMITYMTEPEVEEFANSKGIKVYYSYDSDD